MSDKSYIIGVDTSHSRGQLCLIRENEILKNILWDKKGSHSERLNDNFHSLQSEFSLSFKDIQSIYCSIGPGSFTGLRVGINFCKTLAYAHNIPVFSVNTLQALSLLCHRTEKPVIAAIDAQKNSVFLSQFNQGKAIFENRLIEINKLNTVIDDEAFCCGHGILNYKDYIDSEVLDKLTFDEKWSLPDITSFILQNEQESFLEDSSWDKLKPLYIRLSSAEEKKFGH